MAEQNNHSNNNQNRQNHNPNQNNGQNKSNPPRIHLKFGYPSSPVKNANQPNNQATHNKNPQQKLPQNNHQNAQKPQQAPRYVQFHMSPPAAINDQIKIIEKVLQRLSRPDAPNPVQNKPQNNAQVRQNPQNAQKPYLKINPSIQLKFPNKPNPQQKPQNIQNKQVQKQNAPKGAIPIREEIRKIVREELRNIFRNI